MRGYDETTFGESIADVYDEWFPALSTVAPGDGADIPAGHGADVLDVLCDLNKGGRVLELGIGTGRIALPLAARGIDVTGIDASPAMVERLHAKPGGDAIPVTVGSFADFDLEGTFSLVFVASSTFFGLLTQEDQMRCFQSVARHLDRDGRFVVEAFVPGLAWSQHQEVEVNSVEIGQVFLQATRCDPVAQLADSQILQFSADGRVRLRPCRIRYAWPSELDLMARLAGLRLSERWGGWQREPFTGASFGHVSVYERIA